MNLWGGRFTKPTNQLVYDFNASIKFDKTFASQDIKGSIGHVKMLTKQEISMLVLCRCQPCSGSYQSKKRF